MTDSPNTNCSCEKPTKTPSGRCFNCWLIMDSDSIVVDSPNTMKPREPREFVVHYGETANPRLVQLKGLPIAYAETPTLIEKTPQVLNALKQAELFYEVVKQLEIAFIVCEMNPTTTGQKTLAEIKALIQQCKEASK